MITRRHLVEIFLKNSNFWKESEKIKFEISLREFMLNDPQNYDFSSHWLFLSTWLSINNFTVHFWRRIFFTGKFKFSWPTVKIAISQNLFHNDQPLWVKSTQNLDQKTADLFWNPRKIPGIIRIISSRILGFKKHPVISFWCLTVTKNRSQNKKIHQKKNQRKIWKNRKKNQNFNFFFLEISNSPIFFSFFSRFFTY